MSILGPLILLFWISGDVSSGFQRFCLICICGGQYNVDPLRSTSGASLADYLTSSITAGHFTTCISRGRNWLGFERAIIHTEDKRTTSVPVTRLVPTGTRRSTPKIVRLAPLAPNCHPVTHLTPNCPVWGM